MKKTAARVALAIAGVGIVIGSAPAFAVTASTTGSTAWSNDGYTFYVKDTKADSRSAYGQYTRIANVGEVRTLWNKSGSDTTVSTTTDSPIWQIRACRQEQFASDSCSSWVIQIG
ncbi:hypothetical protein [Kitasatospora purpeofusca]|uniref:hypothetical protein n=1 Tax=Kitasatospora purpeofusca TaxID=67352 RepID=UPI0036D3C494